MTIIEEFHKSNEEFYRVTLGNKADQFPTLTLKGNNGYEELALSVPHLLSLGWQEVFLTISYLIIDNTDSVLILCLSSLASLRY